MASTLGLFAVLTLFVYASALKLVSQPAVKTNLLGTQVHFECKVEGDWDPWNDPIIWYKVLADGDIELNNGGNINAPFAETGRYELSRDRATDPVSSSIDLRISDVKVADNGTYKCIVGKGADAPSVTYPLSVNAAVEQFTFVTDKMRPATEESKQVFEFMELEPTPVTCHAVGGNPQPIISIHRGRIDVTEEFESVIKKNKSGPRGLEEITYDITLSKTDFRASKDNSGHNLKCTVRVPNLAKSKQVITAQMDVQYAPNFECEQEISVFANTKDFRITCHITANPKVALKSVKWSHEVKVVNISANTSMIEEPEYSDNITEAADGKITAEIIIPVVNETHYRVYTLTAKNPLGDRQRTILLSPGTTTTSTTTSKPNPPYNTAKTEGNKGGSAGQSVGDSGNGATQLSAPSLGLTLILTAIYWIYMNHR